MSDEKRKVDTLNPDGDRVDEISILKGERDALAARLAEAVRWKEDAVLMCARRQCATRDKRLAESEARAEAAEARVRELEPDAERYRWLRCGDNDEACLEFSRTTSCGFDDVWMLRLEKLDEKIDFMRAAASARAVQEPPADVFDAMNLPAVNFPTTGEK